MEKNGNNLIYIQVSVSVFDLLLKYAKILPPPARLRWGSIVEAHGPELNSKCHQGKNG